MKNFDLNIFMQEKWESLGYSTQLDERLIEAVKEYIKKDEKVKTYLWYRRHSLPCFFYTPTWFLQKEVKLIQETNTSWKIKSLDFLGNVEIEWLSKDYNKLEEII